VKPAHAAALLLLGGCAALAACSRSGSNVASGDRAQVLHRSIGVDLADVDPQLATDASYYTVLSALLEGLVAEDPVDLHPVPGVASSWEISPEGTRYTFHLRPQARWSNGDPVTAQDFVGSWRRILTPELGASAASQLYLIQGAEAFNQRDGDFSQVGLRTPDPGTLVVTLEHPAPWFLSVLSGPAWMPVPLSTIARHGALAQRGNGWAVPETWVGNGPFVLTGWRHGQQITVARSPTYWDSGNVRLREIHFHAFDSIDTEERAFRAGQLHVTESLPPSKVDAYRKESPGVLRIDPLLGTYFVRLNVRRPGLEDARVRRALALALDRGALAEKVLRGGQTPAYAFTPPGMGSYAPEEAQRGTPDEARKLLDQGGYPGGSGLPALSLLYNTSESHREVAEALQEMWRRELGIEVRLVNQELKSTEEARRAGDYDLLLSSWIADYEDPSSFLDIWRADSGNNFTHWSNTEFEAALFHAERTSDPGERDRRYAKAEQILLEEAPIIPLYHYTHVFLIQPSVHGWNPTLLDHHPYKSVWLGD
jgi:oligopeptide transport system substrate-binding protein